MRRPSFPRGIYVLKFADDGSLVVGVTQQNPMVYVFDVAASSVHQFSAGDATVMSMAMSPDARLLATGDASSSFRVWSLPDGNELKRVSGLSFSVGAGLFSGRQDAGRGARHRQAAERNHLDLRHRELGENH